MTDIIRLYNALGEVEYLTRYPASLGDWSTLEGDLSSTDPEHQTLIEAISRALQKSPTESHIRAQNEDLTIEVGFNDESKVIARKILPVVKADEEKAMQKLQIETRLLRWLIKNTSIPVPKVLSPMSDQHLNFMIMEKLPGETLMIMWGNLEQPAKEQIVKSFAHISLEFFKLDVPQRIGTFVPGPSCDESSEVIPVIALDHSANDVFDNIRQYVDFLFEGKLLSIAATSKDADVSHIDKLKHYVDGLLDELFSKAQTQPALLRCVLAHADLNDTNILVNEKGHVTGIIDWEYQIIKPAILAAEYPYWLWYDACFDPRFADVEWRLWLDSPEESERLRSLYLEIVKDSNNDYYTALTEGAKLRSCVKWLVVSDSDNDSERKRMKDWMDVTL